MQELGAWDRAENLDRWSRRMGFAKSRELACSFCGSMHPDRFMELMERDHTLGTTTKNYKAYVQEPMGKMIGKFYYQHLSEEQRLQFIDMLNSNLVHIGAPGYFHVLPFFCRSNPAG